MIRDDNDQRPFGKAASEQPKLTVHTFEGPNPLVGIPTIVMADLVGITQIDIGQSRPSCGPCGNRDPRARIRIGDVVGTTQRRLRQRREREFRQSGTSDAYTLFGKTLEYRGLALQIKWGHRVFE